MDVIKLEKNLKILKLLHQINQKAMSEIGIEFYNVGRTIAEEMLKAKRPGTYLV